MDKQEINKSLLKSLEETCGASCYHDQKNCKCFGPQSQEVADDLGIDIEELNEGIIYTMEDCAFYDAQKYYYDDSVKIRMGELRELMGPKFNNDELLDIHKMIHDSDKELPEFAWLLAFKKASKETFDNDDKLKKQEYVYLMHTEHSVKIGASVEPINRTTELGTKIPFKIAKVEKFPVKSMFKEEAHLHKKYSKNRLNGEWFDLDEKQIKEITQYLTKQKQIK